MTATCLNGDCLELMKELPDKSVDLFICDLPYGILGTATGRPSKLFRMDNGVVTGPSAVKFLTCPWDKPIDLAEFWTQVKRLCKNDRTPVLMFCNTKFGVDLITSNPSWFRYDLVWSKNRGVGFLTAKHKPMTSHEMIYVFSKKGSFYKMIKNETPDLKGSVRPPQKIKTGIYTGNSCDFERTIEDGKRCPVSVINNKTKQDKRHPTAKPIDLLKWLIERYSNEGDTVLDPTAGSFNSGRASLELGRNYIGIEMDKEFYDKNRIE